MLKLENISKIYRTGDLTQQALDGVSVEFRQSEFVAVLGPSGCGKTTLLNIVGGLDQYTSGDLIINGRSTKDFKDRDWDSYRNHSVGFVFQSYNLIPHQSVLQNVELALSLSGVPKKERRKKAKEALAEVGLGDQLHKKPSQMSGGQMQRVAIARAIVNDPEIILADEPTGALDSETSLQVMDILKELSKKRLVIMVTHNPELAEKYATRIVRILDGRITADSAPLSAEEIAAENERIEELKAQRKAKKRKKERKPSMSFATSFGLSLKNLFTKKGRTALTAFAGSIGIIGIALIYAVSQGMTTYINIVQEETLSSYPLTLEAQHMDLGSMMQTFVEQAESSSDHNKDAVYQKPALYNMVNAMNSMETKENDLAAFKKYIEAEWAKQDSETGLYNAVNGIQYTYNLSLQIYTENVDGEIIHSDTQALMQDMLLKFFGKAMGTSDEETESSFSGSMEMMNMLSSTSANPMALWQEMLPGRDGEVINEVIKKQYELIDGGRWPQKYNEIVLIVDENNEIDDMTLYALGLTSEEEMDAIIDASLNGTEMEIETKKWTYDEIKSRKYRAILGSSCYTKDALTGLYTDLRESNAGMKYLYDNGIELEVVGIIRPMEDSLSTMLSGSIGYTSLLTEHVVNAAADSAAVKAQKEDIHTDIFTGLPFKESTGNLTDEEKEAEFRAYIDGLDDAAKAEAYLNIMCIPTDEQVNTAVEQTLSPMSREDMETALRDGLSAQTGMGEEELNEYIASMTDEELRGMFEQIVAEQYKAAYAQQVTAQLSALPAEQLTAMLSAALPNYTAEQCAVYYDEILTFSTSGYEANLIELGSVDLTDPATVNIYAATFEDKDIIKDAIDKYNDSVDEVEQISYTDYVGLMMSSVTTIINAITYVLIAFVSVSLIVSSIMIGVITLISVQERTKEIGILRAIGASKRNVSSMFNAETVIIGLISGLLGVGVTYLLCIPINAILHALTGIGNLDAILPLPVAAILVAISVALTLISGIIPSRSAAKKDPVVALRTE